MNEKWFVSSGTLKAGTPEWDRAKKLAAELLEALYAHDGDGIPSLAGGLYLFLAVAADACAPLGQQEAWVKTVACGAINLIPKLPRPQPGESVQ